MLGSVLKKVFGTKNDRELKRIAPLVEAVNSLEPRMQALKDEEFSGLTMKLKER
ncbi:MAG: hypothetical protein HY890_07575, partial [Deltaproteobacteria bacterium]|nr:hypothetical protein [Deltaproteobacteria bacterium]